MTTTEWFLNTSLIAFVTLVLPDPDPPVIPMIRGVFLRHYFIPFLIILFGYNFLVHLN